MTEPGQPAVALAPPSLLVSRRAIGYWTLRAGIGWLVVLAAAIGYLVVEGGPGWLKIMVGLLAVAGVGHLIVMPQWRYRVHRWEATGEAVYTQAGWFNQERRIAPISRIQTVDSHRGPLEQLFGLANVTVTTASAAGPLAIHGLDLATAQHLVDQLTQQAQVGTGDAT